MNYLINPNRVHMMDKQLSMNLVTLNSQITTVIPVDNVVSNVSPLSRPVETLVEVSIEAESSYTDISVKL